METGIVRYESEVGKITDVGQATSESMKPAEQMSRVDSVGDSLAVAASQCKDARIENWPIKGKRRKRGKRERHTHTLIAS